MTNHTTAAQPLDLDKAIRELPRPDLRHHDEYRRGFSHALTDVLTLIAQERAAQPTQQKAADTFAHLLSIQRAEAESGDPYMTGLYNGMSMICANIDGDLSSEPIKAVKSGAADTTASASGQTLYEAWVEREVAIVNPKRWEDLSASTQVHWNKEAIYGRATLAPVAAQQGAAETSALAPHDFKKPPLPAADASGPYGSLLFNVSTLCNYGTECFIAGEKAQAAAKAPAAQADDLRLAICDIPLPVYGSNSFQHGFVSAKEAVLDLLSKRAASPASTPEAEPEQQQARGRGV